MATERHSHVQSRDICVSAPTGSGKTLVFVLGVLQVRNTCLDTHKSRSRSHQIDQMYHIDHIDHKYPICVDMMCRARSEVQLRISIEVMCRAGFVKYSSNPGNMYWVVQIAPSPSGNII